MNSEFRRSLYYYIAMTVVMLMIGTHMFLDTQERNIHVAFYDDMRGHHQMAADIYKKLSYFVDEHGECASPEDLSAIISILSGAGSGE